jgi:hypothetical protein
MEKRCIRLVPGRSASVWLCDWCLAEAACVMHRVAAKTLTIAEQEAIRARDYARANT